MNEQIVYTENGVTMTYGVVDYSADFNTNNHSMTLQLLDMEVADDD